MNDPDWGASGPTVLESIGDALHGGRDAVVATVVDVEGSAYRRPGAKMLVDADGTGRGQLTAGCLEDDVTALAADVLAADEPRVETYDLSGEDDVWGLNIGCNGVIDVLVEPLDASYRPLVEAAAAAESVGVVTVLGGTAADGTDLPLGARAYYRRGDVVPVDDRVPECLAAAVDEPAAALVERGDAATLTLETDGGEATVFVDGVRAAPRLALLGSGHDVGPLVDLGKQNGFRVVVVGFRGAVDLENRFPGADEHVSTTPTALAETLDPDGDTYAVVMSHNFVDDRLAVEALLAADVPYIGLMGPRKRFESMLEELEAEGRTFSESALESVYTPVGLDLGADSPGGIATSIVAEVLAVHNDRDPRHLANRTGPIHDRVELGEASDE